METRNVIDYYRYFTTEAIKADLDSKRNNFSVLISNEFHDFNIGSVIRNANAFLAQEVFIYKRRKFDKRGTVGTHNYENLKYVKYVDEFDCNNKVIIGVDNIEQASPLDSFVWPKEHVVMVFGQEQIGITEPLKGICKKFVYIRQFGSVRSLNVGCASAIAMYDYCSKMVS